MKQYIYTLRDKLTDYGMPFTQPNDEVAKRTFIQLANNYSEYAQISADIEIYKIGSFDTVTGKLESTKHEYLGLLKDYKKTERSDQN